MPDSTAPRASADAAGPGLETTMAAAPATAAGTSSSASAPATPKALPTAKSDRPTPVARIWRSVPCSRSPASAPNVSRMMSSGTRCCRTCAAVSAPMRCAAVASWAGRRKKSFCRCASSHTDVPV